MTGKGKKNRKQNRLRSFLCAVSGIAGLLESEINFRIELFCAASALLLCSFFRVTRAEWSLVILCCAMVLSLEGVNTAAECIVDLVTQEYHDLARKAKDAAAGAVLLAAVGAFIIGLLIFWPYIN